MRRHGCHSFAVYNRTYIAMGFHDPVTEYWDLLNGVVMWPVAGERQVEITGPDAASFVQLLTPRNLNEFAVGQCKYLLITSDDGGIVNDPVCLRLAKDHFWLSAADSDLQLYAKGVNAMAGLSVQIRDPDVSVIQIQGPKSADFMAEQLGADLRTLKYYWCREYEIAQAPVIVSRTGWSSEWGYEIYLRDRSLGDTLFEHLVAVGEPWGLRLGAVSQIRRIEGGMLSYGADMGLETNPFEIGLGRLVDVNQPADFLGKAALTELAARAPQRRLTGVAVPGKPLTGFIDPWPLHYAGEAVSRLTSLAYSPRLGFNAGLAIVPAELAVSGVQMVLATPEGPRDCYTHALPFIENRTARS